MEWKKEGKILGYISVVFVIFYFLPVGVKRFDNAILESLYLVKWYAREHVLLCLIPAFFIAGAITVFINQNAVMKYLGPKANKLIAYGVASVSGTILAVCSCTVLPLFAGIYRMGAGLGPACAFLYSGPAINILAIALTARILGLELGIARAIGAILFSIIIGVLMHIIFIKEEKKKSVSAESFDADNENEQTLFQNGLYFLSLVGILVFANWGKPDETVGLWFAIYSSKWIITALFAVLLGIVLTLWYRIKLWKIILSAGIIIFSIILFPETPLVPFFTGTVCLSIITITDKSGHGQEWFSSSWGFAKQILPLLLFGVLVAGLLLGRVGHEGLIPYEWVNNAVGGNSLRANFFASFAGAFMYFATLTEVPILQGLINSGMGKGPALALLLAGPALSLPNMLVIRSVMGTKKTVVFIVLVIVMATFSGMLYGYL
ncbi:MAG: permease [Victivallales bacterium]|nr:permease [Victivallales bacterium]